jgi:non-specific serine/threonine protein kinase
MVADDINNDPTRSFTVINVGVVFSHYKIISKIGAGGMGEVWLAEDTELKRQVALKFLPPHLCQDKDCQTRFKREAQATAALKHPNIVTIHEVSEYNERPFFAMEHIEGKSLRDVIKGKELSLSSVIDLVIQICHGLEKAHEAGIVHRDIKPSNILIDNDSHPKILDFGLATVKGGEKLTKTGSTLGTIGYMSPEQVQGEETDQRSDLFSLGVIIYEMVTGKAPFAKENDAATIHAILEKMPEPLTHYQKDAPAELQQIVDKALEKNPEIRYQNVKDFTSDLRKTKEILESELLTATMQPSIAVMPFTNMSNDEEQEYFCDGMAEDITNDLTHLEGLRVAARTSAFAYKNKLKDIREIGRKLNVGSILEGSVRKAGNRLRITAQLINVADGYHLWSDRYDRELKDVFAIQDEISRNIVEALKITLSTKDKDNLEKVPTKDVQAYDYYLRGREFINLTGRKNLEFACKMFKQAIQRDPNYTLAYTGIASCHSILFMYHGSSKADKEKAMEISQKALELDPDLAEAHVARGLAVLQDENYDEAENEFEAAIRLNPNVYDAYYYYARLCRTQGKLEKAVQLFEKAIAVNPESYTAETLIAGLYEQLNLASKAKAAALRGLDIIEERLKMNPGDFRAISLGLGALFYLGEREKSLVWAERALSIAPDDTGVLYNSACLYSCLGMVEKALDCLEKSIEAGLSSKDWLDNDADFDPIRNHPDFQALLKKLERKK